MIRSSNPIIDALAAGLKFPIRAKFVGANGGSAEIVFASAEECYTISSYPPIYFPFEWTLTDVNGSIARFTQSATDAEELDEKRSNSLN